MLEAIIIIFVLAALGGSYLLTYILMEKNTPKGIAIIHGLAALTGLILLIIYSIYYESYWTSVVIFLLAFIGGLYIFSRDLLGKKIPKFLALGHGTIALIAIFSLVFFVYYKV